MLLWRRWVIVGLFFCSPSPLLAETAPAPAAPPVQAVAVAATSDTASQSQASPSVVEQVPAPAPSSAITEQQPATSAAPANTAAVQAPAAPPPVPTLTVSIDLGSQSMQVSENGSPRYSWPISSGTAQFPTPRGTFRGQWMAKMWYSRKYDNAPMPHAVFINGGVAIHATYHTAALGTPASHGCIRLSPGNAKTFYNLVQRHGLKSTRVAVYGTPKWRGPAVASRKSQKWAAYGANSDSGNFWGWTNSAYDTPYGDEPRLKQRKPYAQKVRPNYYASQQPPRIIYRNGQRYVYVQRRPSPYYYNGY
ncbi:MAG: L,D-transpeptidase [Hyphomicrobium sp.]|nr:L,D-transpeptidase [Hyphomicrobium sp.]